MKKFIKLKLLKKLSALDYLLFFAIIISITIAILYFSREKSVVYVYTVNSFEGWETKPFPPMYWISNSIKKGDVAYDSIGREVAEVLSVDNMDWGNERRTSRLKLKIHALYDKRTKQYRLRDKALQVGSTISLSIGSTKYEGVVSYVGETLEPPGYQDRQLEIEIKVPLVEPYLAQTYNSTFVVKNTEGIEIFRIITAKSVAAEVSVETDRGTIVRSRDPYYKDVYIKAIVRARCQEGVCYFNEVIPIKNGYWIWTQSETSIIEGEARIINIKELKDEVPKKVE